LGFIHFIRITTSLSMGAFGRLRERKKRNEPYHSGAEFAAPSRGAGRPQAQREALKEPNMLITDERDVPCFFAEDLRGLPVGLRRILRDVAGRGPTAGPMRVAKEDAKDNKNDL
jgi:hypothetical protein